MFKTPELARTSAERAAGPAFDSVDALGRGGQASAFMADGFFSAFDDPLVPPRPAGPGDSNYAVTFTLSDAEGDSGTEWDAATPDIEPEAPSSDEIPARTSSATTAGPESWPHRFVEASGLGLMVATLGLLGVLVPTIAYLLWHAIHAGPEAGSSSPTLIAGLVCAVALLMIAVSLVVLAASLTQLVRDVRRLSQQAERHELLGRR